VQAIDILARLSVVILLCDVGLESAVRDMISAHRVALPGHPTHWPFRGLKNITGNESVRARRSIQT
jgi:hypothetical protein